jgi:anaerobic ribonucleoside-triphosphate reductase activating protein
MIKFENFDIVFMEIPKRVALAINISNCQNNCLNCHSPQLKHNIGKELNITVLSELIQKNNGIQCIIFMGEGNDKETLLNLAKHIKSKGLLVALYSGREDVEEDIYLNFDYIKIGPYKQELGPINKKTTNQKLYKIILNNNKILKVDITQELWKNTL